jgi:hypothetical protein
MTYYPAMTENVFVGLSPMSLACAAGIVEADVNARHPTTTPL